MPEGGHIYIVYCEGCRAMGENGTFQANIANRRFEIREPPVCRIVHPSLAPPNFQYQLIRSGDGGKTWEQVWRGWPKGMVACEPLVIIITRDIERKLHSEIFNEREPNSKNA
jgi:hypothetical protein